MDFVVISIPSPHMRPPKMRIYIPPCGWNHHIFRESALPLIISVNWKLIEKNGSGDVQSTENVQGYRGP